MRDLNKKQKALLDKWYNENKDKSKSLQFGVLFFDIDKCKEFSIKLLEQLEQINDFETIIQAINNYISEKGMKEIKESD